MAAIVQIPGDRRKVEKTTGPCSIIQSKGNSRRRDCFVAALLAMTGVDTTISPPAGGEAWSR